MRDWMAAAFACALGGLAMSCSDDSSSSSSESGGGEEVPRDDVLEVTVDGQELPLESDPTTFSTVILNTVTAGFASDMPAFGEMEAGTFAISVTVNATEGSGTFPLTEGLFDIDDATDPLGHVSITPTDLSGFDSVDGEVVVERLSIDAGDSPSLDTFVGSFSGNFDDGEGNQFSASGRFEYH